MRQILSLVLIIILSIGLGGCERWYLEFSTPEIHPAPCPIQDLLLDASTFPDGEWLESGSRSEKEAPSRMGIERIGTGFSSKVDGVVQDVYRFEDELKARKAYNSSVDSWFTPGEYETEWINPSVLDNLVIGADHYREGCNNSKPSGLESCQYVAQYGPYVIKLYAGMRALSYEEFNSLVTEIDKRAISCLSR
jgi:hypothetical protein